MLILVRRSAGGLARPQSSIEVDVNGGERVITMTVGGEDYQIDENHCEALETALRAARLELEARAKQR